MTAITKTPAAVSELKIDGRTAKRLSHLKSGQVLTVKVLKLVSSRSAIIQVAGRQLTVKTQVPLRVGMNLQIRVQRSGSQLVFKPLAGDGVASPLQRPILPQAGQWKGLLTLMESLAPPDVDSEKSLPSSGDTISPKHLHQLLTQTALQSEVADPKILRRFIRNGGLTWEAKLSAWAAESDPAGPKEVDRLIQDDFKALAMKLSSLEGKSAVDTREAARNLANQFEHLQAANGRILEQHGRFFLPFPVFWEGQWSFGQMLLEFSKPQQEDRRSKGMMRVAIMLDMSRLGNVLIEASVLKKAVSASFYVDAADVQAFLTAQLPDLKSKLEAGGFVVHELRCHLLPHEKLAETDLLDRFYADHEGGFDIMI